MAPMVDRLRSPDWYTFLGALQEAIATPGEGDVILAEMLSGQAPLSGARRLYTVIALGDARGSAGPAALRHILQQGDADPGLLGQAVLALAKRCGAAASADSAMAMQTGDESVQEWAVLSLAGAGDDRAWDDVFVRYERHLRQHTRLIENPLDDTNALCYLARHLGRAGSERSTRLVGLIRSNWDNLASNQRAWLNQYWPESCPTGPPPENVAPPDAETITAWARSHFEPFMHRLKSNRSGG